MQTETPKTAEQRRAEEYFAHRREIAAAAKRAGYVGAPVALDPLS